MEWLAPVASWLRELSRGTFEQRQRAGTVDDHDLNEFYQIIPDPKRPPHHGVSVSISGVLDQAVRLGHGGAFVVVPDVRAAPIDVLKYRIEPFDLAALISRAWIAKSEISGKWVGYWERPEVRDWRAKIVAIGSLTRLRVIAKWLWPSASRRGGR